MRSGNLKNDRTIMENSGPHTIHLIGYDGDGETELHVYHGENREEAERKLWADYAGPDGEGGPAFPGVGKVYHPESGNIIDDLSGEYGRVVKPIHHR